jgi:Uma2 family endonuclease
MALNHQHTMTVDEYFELEAGDSENRYEYVDGYVYMMSGGSFNHSTISANIQRILWDLLRGKPCRAYNSDVKVRISQTRYFHPDVTVTCDSQDRGRGDLLQSPKVVFEVLSPSTELKDRTWKLQNYLALPSMNEYILVSTDAPKMEIYRREYGKWIYDICHADDELELTSIDVHFPVKDAYTDIDFAEGNTDFDEYHPH